MQMSLHPDLFNQLRTIEPGLPEWVDNRTAWKMLRPTNGFIMRFSFWAILRDKLLFARSEAAQKRLADWLFERRKIEKAWPPAVITTKRKTIIPQPNTLKI